MDKKIIYKCLANNLKIDISEVEAFDPERPLSDINMSSLTLISFIVDIEREFNIEILDSDLMFDNFSTLNRLFVMLSKYINASSTLKKCLVLDADNVLWHGISGEEEIGFDDHILAFQELLIDLYQKGVILCLCSKNTPECIDLSFEHPRMLLKKEYFAVFLANHTDKVTNICAIADYLNLSADSFVFADDSDYEIGFVELNLPQVTTVKIDHINPDFKDCLLHLFENIEPTSELNRTILYREQKEREKERRLFTSVKEYNASLQTQIVCDYATEKDCLRLAELSARTNQFNLSGVRYSANELKALIRYPQYTVLSLAVRDKYGDMGIVGMAVVAGTTIEAFMISCRVFDRDLEVFLINKVKSLVKQPLCGIYRPNGKNERFSSFYSDNEVSVI